MRQIIGNQRGQVLPIVLALLVFGGLTIAPVLNHAATSLNGCRVIEECVDGIMAADAGIEYAFWCLKNSVSPPAQLSENINNMQVSLQVEDKRTYTLYFGELIQTDSHNNYLSVSGDIVWDAGAQAYKYTITVTWQIQPGTPVIHLEEVGTRLPIGYSYQTGSAADFGNNLSTGEPGQTLDEYGASMLKWGFSSPLPSVSQSNPVQTQTFYITGEGDQESHYAWVVASREDIGEVGEITGSLHKIIATATSPGTGEVTAQIVAYVIQHEGTMSIVSWQVSR